MKILEAVITLLSFNDLEHKDVTIKIGHAGAESGPEEYTRFVFVNHPDRVVVEAYKESEWTIGEER